jgi:biotin transport system substrate-specific component
MYGNAARAAVIARTATFIGLITIGGWIAIPFVPVPLTLQTFFILLAGSVLRRKAILPAAAYIFLGAVNLPVFHNGTAGIGVLLGPTGGYLAGFVPAALIAGLGYESPRPVFQILGLAGATATIYACGVAWLTVSAGIPLWTALVVGVLPFLPGDLLKAAVAHGIAGKLR